jgi:hypothetical protein
MFELTREVAAAILGALTGSILTGFIQIWINHCNNKERIKSQTHDLIDTIIFYLDIDKRSCVYLLEEHNKDKLLSLFRINELLQNSIDLNSFKKSMYLIKDRELKHDIIKYVFDKNKLLHNIQDIISFKESFLNNLKEKQGDRVNTEYIDAKLTKEHIENILELGNILVDCNNEIINKLKKLYIDPSQEKNKINQERT